MGTVFTTRGLILCGFCAMVAIALALSVLGTLAA